MSLPVNLYKRLQNQPYWLASIIVTGLLLALRQIGGLQSLELVAFDHMVRLKADQGPDPRLLVVEVTEEDIRSQREWPMSDQTMASLLSQLQKHNPKAIGLDIYRDIPQGQGQAALKKAFESPKVVAITALGINADDYIPPPPDLDLSQVGFNDFIIDSDGILRRALLFAVEDDTKLYSFALQLSRKYLEAEGKAFAVDGEAIHLGATDFMPLTAKSGGYENINSAGYQILLDYRSSNFAARKVTLSEVMEGKVEPGWIEDKIVLIGVSAPSAKDFFYTPYSSEKNADHVMPGVLVHAQIVSQILSNVLDAKPLFWYWPQWGEIAWIWGWSLIGGFVVWRMKRSALLGILLLACLGVLGGVCLVSFSFMGWVPFAAPAIALLLTSGGLITYQVFYQSFYDPLTELPNRSLFVRRLRRAIQKVDPAP